MTLVMFIIGITLIWWQGNAQMFPHARHEKTRLTYYNKPKLSNIGITPNGSQEKRRGYALKARAPPFTKRNRRQECNTTKCR